MSLLLLSLRLLLLESPSAPESSAAAAASAAGEEELLLEALEGTRWTAESTNFGQPWWTFAEQQKKSEKSYWERRRGRQALGCA